MRHSGAVRPAALAALALLLLCGPAAATTIVVENIYGRVADSDGFLEGDSDPFVEVWIDGQLAGVTPTLQGTNIPSWPTFSCSLPITPGPGNTPLVTVELRVWDAEMQNVPPEYQGAQTHLYDWVAGVPVTVIGPIQGPHPSLPSGLNVTIRLEDAVSTDATTWSGLKALWR